MNIFAACGGLRRDEHCSSGNGAICGSERVAGAIINRPRIYARARETRFEPSVSVTQYNNKQYNHPYFLPSV